MQAILFVLLVGLAGGIAIGFQAPLSSLISQRLGMMESVFIIHLGGTLVALVPLLFMRGGRLGDWQQLPWYALGAGAFGLVLITALSYTIPRLGAATTIILVVAGQLIVALLLDHFGLLGMAVRPLQVSRLVGIAVVFAGVWLLVR